MGNEEFYKNQIIYTGRNQFIYGYNTKERKDLLESIDKEYPIIMDSNKTYCIYLDEIGLPKKELNDVFNKHILTKVVKRDKSCFEFLDFSIAKKILEKLKTTNDINLINKRLKKLFEFINEFDLNYNYPKINDIDELIKVLNYSKEFYKKNYLSLCDGLELKENASDLPCPSIELEDFLNEFKESINNLSRPAIILDKQDSINKYSTIAINDIFDTVKNIKVVIEPGDWTSYINTSGQKIERVHDYSELELDDSYKEYSLKLRNKKISEV